MDANENAEHDDTEYQPPEVDEATGVSLHKGLPVNRRLRAEALVAAGETTDPEGMVDDDTIADTAKRLAGEETEAEKADRALDRMSEKRLREIVTAEGVSVEGDADKPTIRNAIRAHRAAAQES